MLDTIVGLYQESILGKLFVIVVAIFYQRDAMRFTAIILNFVGACVITLTMLRISLYYNIYLNLFIRTTLGTRKGHFLLASSLYSKDVL